MEVKQAYTPCSSYLGSEKWTASTETDVYELTYILTCRHTHYTPTDVHTHRYTYVYTNTHTHGHTHIINGTGSEISDHQTTDQF